MELIVLNTCAVLGPASERRDEWHLSLEQMRKEAVEVGAQGAVALLDAVIQLLDADGDPTGLGRGLTRVYAQVWQELIGYLT